MRHEDLRALRNLAGKLPCDMCLIKGGAHIQPDGGCRHRPSITGHNDSEVLHRLKRLIDTRPSNHEMELLERRALHHQVVHDTAVSVVTASELMTLVRSVRGGDYTKVG